MSVRAIILGLLFGTFLAAAGWFNDWVLKQSFIASDLVPISVYGLLVLGLLTVHPLLWSIRALRMKAGEWCVIVALALGACVIPGPGLMWNFSNMLIMPHHYAALRPGWQKMDLLGYVPKPMLADPSQGRDVVADFMTGSSGPGPTSLGDVPWSAWLGTLSFWMPLLALCFVGSVCLIVVVHRQWSDREHLRYPIADFASSLLDGADESRVPPLFRNRLFWLGFGVAGVVLLLQGLSLWTDGAVPMVATGIDLSALVRDYPKLAMIPHSAFLLTPTLYFAAVGFAYFVSSDVSFSLGISHVGYGVVFIAATTAGINMGSDYLGGGIPPYLWFGAYLGVALTLVYLGRNYYGAVLARAFRPGWAAPASRADVGPEAVWALRIGLLCAVGAVLILVLVAELNWLLAVLAVLLTGMLFLVVARISVETGLFFVQPGWHAVGILLALFGAKALGPNMLIILGILSVVLTIDPRVCVAPMVANALKLGQSTQLKPGRLASWMTVAVLLALAVGAPVTLYFQYAYGGGLAYEWANNAARMPFQLLARQLPDMELTGPGGQPFRLGAFAPDADFLVAAGAGLALVVACSWLRLRTRWWPLHPVFFLVWGTFPANRLAASFLFGWAVKSAISRLGGGRSVARAKPLFVGLVAGEFAIGLLWMLWGLGYYLHTGVGGPIFRVHP